MDNLINSTIESKVVMEAGKQIGLSSKYMWELYFETGMAYVDILKDRIRRKRIFDAMFRPFLSNKSFGKMHLPEVIEMIRFSPDFWFWWSTQVFSVCHNKQAFIDEHELFYRLQFHHELIPHFILNRIIYAKQNTNSRQGTIGKPESEVGSARTEERQAGSEINIWVRNEPLPGIATREKQH